MRRRWTSGIMGAAMAVGMSAEANADDVKVVRDRFVEHLHAVKNTTGVADHLASQQPDGSWADVDYDDDSRANWSPHTHLNRLVQMAAAWSNPNSVHFGDATMLAGIETGLQHWNEVNPSTPNTYDRAIGGPMKLGDVLALTHGRIDTSVRNGIVDYMGHVILDDGYSREGDGGGKEIGADVARAAYVHMTVGMATDDREALATASSRIQAEAKIVGADRQGLQQDGAYHYHGSQLFSPWYAETHYQNTALWAEMTADTDWRFGDNTRTFTRKGILEGWHWMTRRGQWDPFTNGRGTAVQDQLDVNVDWVEGLKASDPAFADEYQAFIDHNAGTNDASLVGNKHFHSSDYMSHRRETFMLSVRMISNRTENQETGNGQNVRNRWLSHGTTAIMVDGDEYQDIQPIWDWRRIPGTTASSIAGNKLTTGAWGLPGVTSFVGGASDGDNGVAAMDLRASETHDRKNGPAVTGKKSWFMFGDTMVALGAGINYEGNTPPVVTTVNQVIKNGDVISSTDGSTTTEPTTSGRSLAGVDWVWHDKVGYIFPTTQNVELKNENDVTGDWASISPGSYSPGEHTETKDRFTLTINHGDPDDAHYAYMVVPGKSQSAFEQHMQQMDIEILANTPELAAVRDHVQQLTGIVFYDHEAANSQQIRPGFSIEVNEQMILLVDETGPTPTIALDHPGSTLPGAMTITYPGITGLMSGDEMLSTPDQGEDWVTVNVPAGVKSLTVVASPPRR